jgi:uncharacterized protein
MRFNVPRAGGVLAFMMMLSSPVLAQPERAASDSTVVIIAGTGVRFVRPNAASLVIAFDATDSTKTRAAQNVALKADSVRRALEKLGIPRDSVVSASSWYWWRGRIDSLTVETSATDTVYYWSGFKRTPSGLTARRRVMWRVHDRLQVRMSNPAVVGRVFDVLLGLGISDVADIRFTRTSDPALVDTLMQEAARDARRRAELLAAASGMKVDRLIELSTQELRSFYGREDNSLGSVVVTGFGSGGDGDTQIRPADLRIAATVYTRWRLVSR